MTNLLLIPVIVIAIALPWISDTAIAVRRATKRNHKTSKSSKDASEIEAFRQALDQAWVNEQKGK